MRQERFHTLVGLFMGGAIILSVFTALFFFDVFSHEKGNSYVMFFNGSLDGLDTTSTVTYRGIKIGEVRLIALTENASKHQIKIPVYVQFFVEKSFIGKSPLQILIDQGFVANITKPNLLTGISSIELVKPQSPRVFNPLTYNGYPVFPTKKRVEGYITIDKTLKIAQTTLQDIGEFINSPRVRETIDAAKAMTNRVNQLADNLDQQFPSLVTTFAKTLMQISDAANSAQNLADYLSRNPESLLRGKP